MPGAYQRFSVDQIPSQQGKIALVTGGNGGIGYQTVKQLALAGAKVYMASRSEEKATKAIKELKEEAEKQGKQVQIEFISIDLCSLQSAVDCAKEFSSREKSLDLLVCNAGIMAVPHELTKDGLEIQFQSNYLTHHLLFLELVPQLKAAASQSGTPSRVVNLSSFAHNFITYSWFGSPDFTSIQAINRKFGPSQAGHYFRYSQAKLSAILQARQINKRYSANEIRATAVHPGFIASDLYKGTPVAPFAKKILSPVEDGALATLYVSTSHEPLKEESWDTYRGTYGLPQHQTAYSQNDKLGEDLWNLSEAIIKEKL